jgi:hypothetical protein
MRAGKTGNYPNDPVKISHVRLHRVPPSCNQQERTITRNSREALRKIKADTCRDA